MDWRDVLIIILIIIIIGLVSFVLYVDYYVFDIIPGLGEGGATGSAEWVNYFRQT